MRVAIVLIAALVLSCRHEAVATRPRDRDTPKKVDDDRGELPRVRVLADIAEHHGKRVVVEGLYEIDPIRRGKGGNKVWLVLADGARISRAYDALKSELAYGNRRVLATGKLTSGPPDTHVQAMMAPHLALETLALAPSEPPLESDVVDIPAPPIASASPQLAPRIDRWVQVVATLSTLTGDTATLKLADGATLRVEGVHVPTWSSHIGKSVTVIGRLAVEKAAAGAFALSLVMRGPTEICAGAVTRCGM